MWKGATEKVGIFPRADIFRQLPIRDFIKVSHGSTGVRGAP